MKDLAIFEKKGTLYTDSRKVADVIGKRHDNLLRDIARYIKVLQKANAPNFGEVNVLNFEVNDFFVESSYQDEKGKFRSCYLLTRKGCDMVANRLSGEKGILFAAQYVNRFHQMEKALLERDTALWMQTRERGKLTRKSETDVIKQLIEYAKSQGSQHAEQLYTVYSKLAKKMAGITSRDTADVMQLNTLTMIENIILKTIQAGMSQGKNYREIYQLCKARLESFQTIAYLQVS